jgi:hypothetical protein
MIGVILRTIKIPLLNKNYSLPFLPKESLFSDDTFKKSFSNFPSYFSFFSKHE